MNADIDDEKFFTSVNVKNEPSSEIKRAQSQIRVQKVRFSRAANQSSIYTKADTGSELMVNDMGASHIVHKTDLLPKL